MNLQEIRQKYPQYNNLSDNELADKLYNKFYANKIPQDTFYQKIGLTKSTQQPIPQTPSTLDKVVDFINNLGGGVSSGMQNVGKNVINFIPQMLGKEDVIKNTLRPPFADPNSLTYLAGQGLGSLAAGIPLGFGAAKTIPSAITSNLARGALAGAATGAASMPDGFRGVGAATGGLLGTAGGVLAPLITKAQPINYLSSLLGRVKNNPQLINSSVAKGIRKAYQAVKDENSNLYRGIKEGVQNAGFSQDVEPTSHSLISGIQQKSIIPINSGTNLQGLAKNIKDFELKKAINRFIKNPSFDNAHGLQSDLGQYGSYYLKNPNSSMEDRKLGANILGVRDNLIQDIKNSFINSGNPQLANQFEEASQHYLNNIVPYKNHLVIKKIVENKKAIPSSNLSNILLKEDPSVTPILEHLQTHSPETSNLLLFQKLNTGNLLKNTPKGDLKLERGGLNKLANNINYLKKIMESPEGSSLTENLSNIMDEGKTNALDQMLNAINKKKALAKAGVLTGAAVGVPEIYHKGKNILTQYLKE